MDMEIAPDAEFLSPLLGLPDDALLAVLAYLQPEQLLDCRRVCRRLRDICLHPDLWRSASITGEDSDAAALRLAPCVGKVVIGDCFEDVSIACAATIMATSQCAIKSLELTIRDKTDLAAATTLLRRVSDRGGLQELTINFNFDVEEQFNFELLEMKASLVNLTYFSNDEDNFLLLKLLSLHSATLQHVGLLLRNTDFRFSKLRSIPNLRSLYSFTWGNLCEMLPSASLRTIKLEPAAVGELYSPGALAFLREASHLRSVSLWLEEDAEAAALHALASSPSARQVETLRLRGIPPALLEHLADSVQHFPSINTLELRFAVLPSDLRFINPSSAPSLSMLKLSARGNTCPHEFLHSPVLTDLLTRNPGLHVRLRPLYFRVNCECMWCKWGCHAERSLKLAFSAHRRLAGCPKDCITIMLCPSCQK